MHAHDPLAEDGDRGVIGRLLELARDATRGATFVERMELARTVLTELIPARSVSASVLPLAGSTFAPGFAYSWRLDPRFGHEYVSHFMTFDPRGEAVRRATGEPVVLSEFVPDRRFGQDAFTADYYGPRGIRYAMSCVHRMPDGRTFGFGMHRERAHGDFTLGERRIFALASHDLARAAATSIIAATLARPERTASPWAPLLFDRTGRLMDAEVATLTLLHPFETADVIREVTRLVQRELAAERVRGAAFDASLRSTDGRLSAKVTTTHRESCIAAVAMLSQSTPPCEPDHLTVRESEVAALISRGVCNKDVARRLGLSLDTVKFHVKRIYKKLGVRSRIELVMRGGAR